MSPAFGPIPYFRARLPETKAASHPAMATTADVNIGSYIRFNGDICQIMEWQHRTPGNLRAFYQGKMRNLRNGKLAENRWRSGETIEVLRVEVHELQYLYREGDNLVCMDQESFEQKYIPVGLFGGALGFMKEEMVVQIGFESEQPIFARPPKTVELKVVYTEPAVKGDTANKVMKPAKLETGVEINVPIFVEEGTVVRIDTESGEYMDRVKK
jgi:elongation factor P